MAETLLALRDVTVEYGHRTALLVSSLDVHAGEVLALIGPNGAGKSTLLRVMGLLQEPTAGKVFFRTQESDPRNALYLRRRMASVFKEPLLLNASVYENAALGLRLRGLKTRETEARLRPWLERLGIDHLAERRVRTLSGGEAQRTSLARALVLDPELLLLDEPFSALDEPTRDGLLDDLQRVLRMIKTTTVFVTHDRNEAFRLANRVGILLEGKIVQLGPGDEVFSRPNSEKAADIMGFENRIQGVVQSIADGIAVIRFSDGSAAARGEFPPGTRVIMCIRAEDVSLIRCDEKRDSSWDLNRFRGKVTCVSAGMLQYRVAVNNGNIVMKAAISGSRLRDLDLCEGNRVVATFEASAVHLVKDGEQRGTVA
jgi:tungstate transport system ATP-binding protein